MNKWLCKIFGCQIIKRISPGFFHVECKRCGDIFCIKSSEGGNWYERACNAILVDCCLFGSALNISDYKRKDVIEVGK